MVNAFKIGGNEFHVFVGHITQAVAHHVNNAQLHFGARICNGYGVGETSQAVNAGDEDVLDATILQLGEHR
jgi:hypothetical protein